MADDTDSQFTKFMILRIGQCLRRGDHDSLAGMDTQRVEVLHVTYSDAVIITVTDHFILHLLPAFQDVYKRQYLSLSELPHRTNLIYLPPAGVLYPIDRKSVV